MKNQKICLSRLFRDAVGAPRNLSRFGREGQGISRRKKSRKMASLRQHLSINQLKINHLQNKHFENPASNDCKELDASNKNQKIRHHLGTKRVATNKKTKFRQPFDNLLHTGKQKNGL